MEILYCFSQGLHQSAFPPTVHDGSLFSASSPALVCCFINDGNSDRYEGKQPKCPSVNEWFKKQWYIYTMEYYTAERKEEFLPFATAWMELESIMLSEISQLVKDKYI